MRVSEILTLKKGNLLYTVTPQTFISSAIHTMAEKDIGSLVVIEHDRLVGMLTFREVLNAIHQNQGKTDVGNVGQYMDNQPLAVTPNTDLNEVRRIMLEKHTRYLPVIDGNNISGVISFYDVARAVLEAQNFENQMLKAYIHDWSTEIEH
jgi:CBS domain-containing protein